MTIDCKHLPQADGVNGWYETLPPLPEPRRLASRITADWAVLGAGLAGLAAARRLAELDPNADVVLIDAQRVGFGAAGRNSGFMIDLPHDLQSHDYAGAEDSDRDKIHLNRSAIDYMRSIVQRHDIDCDWQEQGKIHGAINERGGQSLRAFSESLNRLGESNHLLDARAMQTITGTTFYAEGLFTPGTVLLQPAALTRGLAATLPDNVRLFEQSPVTTLDLGPPHCLKTADGELHADRLVLANNAYAAQFGAFGFDKQLLPIYTYGSLTRPMTDAEAESLGGESAWGLIPADPMGTTVRRMADGRICIRNSFTYSRDVAAGSRAIERVRRRHEKSCADRFPMLEGMTFDYTWGGSLCMTRNGGVPFGEVGQNVYSAVCQNGLGLTGGTIAGKLIAEYALGMGSDELRIMREQPKPTTVPPEPFRTLGVQGLINWNEFRAGPEI